MKVYLVYLLNPYKYTLCGVMYNEADAKKACVNQFDYYVEFEANKIYPREEQPFTDFKMVLPNLTPEEQEQVKQDWNKQQKQELETQHK